MSQLKSRAKFSQAYECALQKALHLSKDSCKINRSSVSASQIAFYCDDQEVETGQGIEMDDLFRKFIIARYRAEQTRESEGEKRAYGFWKDATCAASTMDGYCSVTLSVKSKDADNTTDHLSKNELASPFVQTSTLQYFARAGGLASLSRHLQLYYPYLPSAASELFGLSRNKQEMFSFAPWISVGLSWTPSEFDSTLSNQSYGDMVHDNPLLNLYSAAVNDIEAMYDEFEFIDAPLAESGKSGSCPNNFGSTDHIGGQATTSMKLGAQPQKVHAATFVYPHVIVASTVFLRLDGYAELFVTHDRKRAKSLLRLAMAVPGCESGQMYNDVRYRQRLIYGGDGLCAYPMNVTDNSESESLCLLPFIVLEKLYSSFPPDTTFGKSIRNATIEHGILDILLHCLAHYSHQNSKEKSLRPVSMPSSPDTVSLIENLLRISAETEQAQTGGNCGMEDAQYYSGSIPNTSTQNTFWAKGTGYGSGTTQQQWNVDLHVMKRKHDELNVTHLLRVLSCFIYPKVNQRLEEAAICRLSETSSSAEASPRLLHPSVTLSNSLPDANGLQRKDQFALSSAGFESGYCLSSEIVEILMRSCLLPTIWAYLRSDSVLDISQHASVYEAVVQLISALALTPPAHLEGDVDGVTALLSQCESDLSLLSLLRKLHECILAYLTKLVVENNDQQHDSNDKSGSDAFPQGPREEGLMRLETLITATCILLSQRVVEDLGRTQKVERSARSAEEIYTEVMKELQFVASTSSLGKRTRRLAQEIVTLSKSLPLSASSSVFVRAAEERLDVMKVLITGPADTPYMNGCFEFDVWFPSDYPNSPMRVHFETTGSHSVRFNPNLYNDGKVCLSVLNTWHGRPEERWNPDTSNLLQASHDYDANIRQAVVRWGMLEMIRRPPLIFADIIKKHFWLKRDEINSQLSRWIDELESSCDEQQAASRSVHAHLSALKRYTALLKEEFGRMVCPEDWKDLNLQTTAEDRQVEPCVQSQQIMPVNSLASLKILKL